MFAARPSLSQSLMHDVVASDSRSRRSLGLALIVGLVLSAYMGGKAVDRDQVTAPRQATIMSDPAETGVVARWNHNRGFGFITPDDGSEDLFAHVRSLTDGEGSVDEGDKVTFTRALNERTQKTEAEAVQGIERKQGNVQKGLVARWREDRGFGFIAPDDGSEELFFHLRGLIDGEGSVAVGDKVTFTRQVREKDGESKEEAASVRAIGGGRGKARGKGAQAYERDEMFEAFKNFMLQGKGKGKGGGKGTRFRSAQDLTPGPPAAGEVAAFYETKGFGFIAPEAGGEDVFFHVKDQAEAEEFAAGDRVTYNPAWDDMKGKWKALNVRKE